MKGNEMFADKLKILELRVREDEHGRTESIVKPLETRLEDAE